MFSCCFDDSPHCFIKLCVLSSSLAWLAKRGFWKDEFESKQTSSSTAIIIRCIALDHNKSPLPQMKYHYHLIWTIIHRQDSLIKVFRFEIKTNHNYNLFLICACCIFMSDGQVPSWSWLHFTVSVNVKAAVRISCSFISPKGHAIILDCSRISSLYCHFISTASLEVCGSFGSGRLPTTFTLDNRLHVKCSHQTSELRKFHCVACCVLSVLHHGIVVDDAERSLGFKQKAAKNNKNRPLSSMAGYAWLTRAVRGEWPVSQIKLTRRLQWFK